MPPGCCRLPWPDGARSWAITPAVLPAPQGQVEPWTGDLGLQASHTAAGSLRQSRVHLKMLKLEDRDSHARGMLAAVSWGEAEGRENHGRLELEKPLPSSWPDGSPGNSAALCKICFRVTQAGSLAASPRGEGPASSVEEAHASRLAGTSRSLAAASSLLAVPLRPPWPSRLSPLPSHSYVSAGFR
ncbi:unnamed protein product [Rangifer tarandus platyrhynchus]|uniref:Uncharacterized protein n=1 Tax=Rangifer tarandus platyrhynchus TaxID=3082113 RepID=A0ABN8ZVT2_RANTA|nr:unnamed protein product [Rangifer tarandus platyrhynchus]